MKTAVLACVLATAPACTLVGAGTGALVGNFAGSTGEGALIGAVVGLRVDIALAKSTRDLAHWLIFWAR